MLSEGYIEVVNHLRRLYESQESESKSHINEIIAFIEKQREAKIMNKKNKHLHLSTFRLLDRDKCEVKTG